MEVLIMFCPDCGKEIAAGEVKCSVCGHEFENAQEATVAIPESDAEKTVFAAAEPEATVATAESAPVGEDAPEIRFAVDEDAPKKKKSKLPAIIAIIASVAIILAGAAFFFWDEISLLWAGPEEHFQYDTKEAVSSMAEGLTEIYSAALDSLGEDMASSGEFKIDLSDELIDLLGYDIPTTLGITYNITYEGAKYALDLALNTGDEAFISANAILDLNELAIYISVPELYDDTFVLDVSDFLNYGDMSTVMSMLGLNYDEIIETIQSLLPEPDMIGDMFEKYMGAIIDALYDVYRDKDTTLEIRGVTQKNLTKYEVSVTPKMMADVACSVIETFFDDELITDYIADVCDGIDKLFSGNPLINGKTVKKEIDKTLNTLEDEYNKSKKSIKAELSEIPMEPVDITIWMDENNTVIAFSLETNAVEMETTVDGDEVVSTNTTNTPISVFMGKALGGDKAAYDFSVKYADETLVSVGGSGVEKKGAFTGEWAVEFEGEKLFSLKFKDFQFSNMLNGSVKVAVTESVYVELSGVTNDKECTVTLSAGMGGTPLASITIGSKMEKPGKIEIPENLSSETDIESFFSDISLFDIQDIIEESGIDLEELMGAAEAFAEYLEEMNIDLSELFGYGSIYDQSAESVYGDYYDDFDYYDDYYDDYDDYYYDDYEDIYDDYEDIYDDYNDYFDEEDYDELYEDLMDDYGDLFEGNEDEIEDLYEDLF